MRQSERDRKEKQVRAWLEELNDLYRSRKGEIVHLPKPVFRGYLLSFELTEEGERFMSDRHKELFYMDQQTFFVKDKLEAKKAKPNLNNYTFGDHFRDPDNSFYSWGYFWPLIVRDRNGEIRQIEGKQKITSKELESYFKPVKEVELSNDWRITYHALKIPDEYFTVKKKKYKQKRAWVEDAHVDARLDFLNKKLFEEKNWHKYGPETTSNNREPGKQPEGLYYSNHVGMSPALPYKRSAQKEQTQTLIEKNINKNGIKSDL